MPPTLIPWHHHVTKRLDDFEADGDPDLTEVIQIGGTTTGLQITMGNLTDPNNADPQVADASFVAAANGRYARMYAISTNPSSGTVNFIAPGTPGPGKSNVVQFEYTTGAMPSAEELIGGPVLGPFPGP